MNNLILKLRCYLIVKLIGKMPVVVNFRISDYDISKNITTDKPSVVYNNVIYNLDREFVETEQVYTGTKDDVKVYRTGNSVVLKF